MALRAGDGLEALIAYTPGHGPGIWEPVPTYPAPPPNTPPAPAAPWMAQFKPFARRSADQFLDEVRPPLSLASKAWAHDVLIQPGIPRARAYASAEYGRGSPSGRDVERRVGGFDPRLHERQISLRILATYTAIHDADTDGNSNTVADPDWTPPDVTPGHPEYPANHGCATEALMDSLTEFFETDEVPYTVTSAVTGTTHQSQASRMLSERSTKREFSAVCISVTPSRKAIGWAVAWPSSS